MYIGLERINKQVFMLYNNGEYICFTWHYFDKPIWYIKDFCKLRVYCNICISCIFAHSLFILHHVPWDNKLLSLGLASPPSYSPMDRFSWMALFSCVGFYFSIVQVELHAKVRKWTWSISDIRSRMMQKTKRVLFLRVLSTFPVKFSAYRGSTYLI